MSDSSDSSLARVLVVSDDPAVRDAAAFGFPFAAEVTFALDAREASSELAADRPDVVVVDLQTGSAGGFALVRDMQSDPNIRTVPVLMLLERSQDAWLAKSAGATMTRVKPISASVLADTVAGLVTT